MTTCSKCGAEFRGVNVKHEPGKVKVICRACKTPLNVPEKMAGQTGTCPKCGGKTLLTPSEQLVCPECRSADPLLRKAPETPDRIGSLLRTLILIGGWIFLALGVIVCLGVGRYGRPATRGMGIYILPHLVGWNLMGLAALACGLFVFFRVRSLGGKVLCVAAALLIAATSILVL